MPDPTDESPPPMRYRMLTAKMQMDLLSERLTELESDHFRAMLRAEEVEGRDAGVHAREVALMKELRTRIERHVGPDEVSATSRGDDESSSADAAEPTKPTAGPDGDESNESSPGSASLDATNGHPGG